MSDIRLGKQQLKTVSFAMLGLSNAKLEATHCTALRRLIPSPVSPIQAFSFKCVQVEQNRFFSSFFLDLWIYPDVFLTVTVQSLSNKNKARIKIQDLLWLMVHCALMTQIHLISASPSSSYEHMRSCLRFWVLHTNWQLSRKMEATERVREDEWGVIKRKGERTGR